MQVERASMSGEQRREQIIQIIKQSACPVSGTELAKQANVSRQVIVQDIALLRANGVDIISTNRGYIIRDYGKVSRVFKVIHTEEQVEEELNLFVDFGGFVKDVFVYHKVYNVLKADMNLKSRADVRRYLGELKSGKSSLLMNVTSGYHYHTILADSEDILDVIQEELWEKGFLAKLQEYEPVEFGKKNI